MPKKKAALDYHARNPAGKIMTALKKPLDTQEDLSLAYSPGVAEPCLAIAADQSCEYEYTGKGNLIGVISNGSAVLGLGDIGPAAAKPVMEGKAMLFKKFADIDVFDIEVDAKDPDEFIRVVRALEPTFGGINLEDIKAPECFYIEEKLRAEMNIPVFHDDQHGTAIISGAAFLNALEITDRDIGRTKVVFSGAGAAAIACAQLFLDLGVAKENLIMVDSRGVIYQGRKEGMNDYKMRFAAKTDLRSLADAMQGADAFVGVSAKGLLSSAMVASMAPNPIIFALANPDPEILPDEALAVRQDVIMATGRSDYPNQVNNVLGFPFIFRGALDVRATTINEEMKIAAVRAIAALAKEDVPEEVLEIYQKKNTLSFGRDYLIPKPVDPRVLMHVAPAVAQAAMASGVARKQIDMESYVEHIEKILGPTKQVLRQIKKGLVKVARKTHRRPRIVFPHGHGGRMIKAATQIAAEGVIDVVLLGDPQAIAGDAKAIGFADILNRVTVVDPVKHADFEAFVRDFFELRGRKGVSLSMAREMLRKNNYFAAMMIRRGEVDGMVTGLVESYAEAVRPAFEVLGIEPGIIPAGIKLVVCKNRMYFFADCTINIQPTPEEIAEIAINTVRVARHFTADELRVALLSFSSFGSSRHKKATAMAEVASILAKRDVDFVFDGEIQGDVATDPKLQESEFPFCKFAGSANILIFPDLQSANLSYKLLDSLGGATCIGPILIGPNGAVNVLERGAGIEEIVTGAYITAAQAFRKEVVGELFNTSSH